MLVRSEVPTGCFLLRDLSGDGGVIASLMACNLRMELLTRSTTLLSSPTVKDDLALC